MKVSSLVNEQSRGRQDSRLSLLLAAERYFALHGIQGVSLSAIQRASGHKNASATQYHFGSRDGLIEALLDLRMPGLNRRRTGRLEAYRQSGAQGGLRTLLALWIEPLADELRPRPEGNYYLRFLDRLRREASAAFAPQVNAAQAGYAELFAEISGQLTHLPAKAARSRIGIAADQLVASLAGLEEALPEGALPQDYPDFAVQNLIDYIAGGLTSPLDPRTAAAAPGAIDFHLHFFKAPAAGGKG